MNILFITWDGPQVSYLESLFVPIFRRLQDRGDAHFHVLQFTWGDAANIERSRGACERAGISYRAVRIRRWPKMLGALITAVEGAGHVRSAMGRHAIDVVMPRSTLPGLAALLAVRRQNCPIVFDADGLPLDERVDFAGQSPSSLAHRLQRDIEGQVVHRAAIVLTRTAGAAQILQARAGAGIDSGKFHVVSNGRDAVQFYPHDARERWVMRERLGIPQAAPLLAYAGSLGSQYCVEEMLQVFERVRGRCPDARLLVLSGATEVLQHALSRSPVPLASVIVHSVPPDAVPAHLACADLGLALRRRSFSMQAVAPIKLGEYLLCGLPVLATAGVGDAHVLSTDTGLAVDDVSAAQAGAVADWFVDTVMPDRDGFRARCRALGVARFSLDASVDSYARALDGLSHVR